MNGFVLLSVSIFICFTYQILRVGFCNATNWAGLHRDPNKQLSYMYAQFKEHFYHALDVSKLEKVAVQTGRQCLLHCLNNHRCFSTNIGAFHLPDGNFSCELLQTDKYNASNKFKVNHTFHHYSIRVSFIYIHFTYVQSHLTFALKLGCMCENTTLSAAERVVSCP